MKSAEQTNVVPRAKLPEKESGDESPHSKRRLFRDWWLGLTWYQWVVAAMAMELIRGERTIRALKCGAKRLNDGGGLYLLPFTGGDAHYWRLDYTHYGRRKTLSLGVHPEVDLVMAREKAAKARAMLARGLNPSQERRQIRSAQVDPS